MNVPLCLIALFLRNLTTNFDETLHVGLASTGLGFEIVSRKFHQQTKGKLLRSSHFLSHFGESFNSLILNNIIQC